MVRRLDDRMMLVLQLSNVGMARTATGELERAVAGYEEGHSPSRASSTT